MSEKRFTIGGLAVTALATFTVTLGAAALLLRLLLGPGGFAMLQGAMLVNTRFVGEADGETVADLALTGMVAGLEDRWSLYLTPEQYRQVQKQRENAYIGIGITYLPSEAGDAMVIQSLAPGGPAETAGLLVGERIVAVDGTELDAENFDELVDGIGDQVGQETVLTVEDDRGERRDVTLTLAQVRSESAEYEMLEGDIGYVRLNNFYQNSAESFREAVDALVDRGARALVFDMRNNPGGYVDQLTQMLDYLLPEGPIFAEHTKRGPVHVIRSDEECVDLPMAVLINGDSYSAAELFAAQLRESVQAPLIGERTCGKGYYQQVFELCNGGAVNLSTGMYTTGGGTSLIGVGLTPDVQEEDPEEQLETAVECLREKVG